MRPVTREALRRSAPSLTEAVYRALRTEILDCVIEPGAKLKIAEIAARFGVNLGPVREALSRLAAEGLVVSESQKGFRASPVSVPDFIDLTHARIEIEMLCFKSSIAAGGVDWESNLVAAFHRLIRTPEFEGEGRRMRLNENWAVAHADFHRALVAACESRWLLRVRETLYDQSERYRRLTIPLRARPAADGRSSRQDRDHRKLLDAALARDETKAARAMTEHLNRTVDIVRGLGTKKQVAVERHKAVAVSRR